MITLKIDDAEIEHQLLELVNDQKIDLETVTIQAIKAFIDIYKENKLVYQKKEVTTNSTVIQREVDLDNKEVTAQTTGLAAMKIENL